MRIRAERARRIGDAHNVEQFFRATRRGFPGEAEMQPSVLGQLPADREHRVQRRHRILEDHADLQAGDAAQLAAAQA
jgi:hypothetical protein